MYITIVPILSYVTLCYLTYFHKHHMVPHCVTPLLITNMFLFKICRAVFGSLKHLLMPSVDVLTTASLYQ